MKAATRARIEALERRITELETDVQTLKPRPVWIGYPTVTLPWAVLPAHPQPTYQYTITVSSSARPYIGDPPGSTSAVTLA